MIKYFRNKLSFLDIHTHEVVLKSISSSAVKVIGMTIGLLVSIFLGRTLGAEGLGIINLSNRVVTLIIMLCLLGMQQVLIKEVAIGYNRKDWQHIGDVTHTAYLMNGAVTLVVSVIFILISPWLSHNIFNEPRLTIPLSIAFIVMTPQVFSRLFASSLIGYRKIWQSNLVDQTLSLGIVGIILLLLWLLKVEITIISTAIAYAFGRVIVMLSVGLYWNKLFSLKGKRKFLAKSMLKTSLPLLLVTSTAIISASASLIMLGWLDESKQVGLYSVAARIALLTSFFLQVTNSAISPKLASLYADGKIREMGKMVQRVTKGLSIIAFVPLFIFIIAGKSILSLWSAEFIEAYWILVILSIGQFFNISTGATGVLLNMCGFEKIQGRISTIFVLLNLILNYILIRHFGAKGAAIATAITVAGINIVRVIYVKKKINIFTISFLN